MSQYEFRKVIALALIDPKNYCKINNNKRSIDKANDNDKDAITIRSSEQNKRKITHVLDYSFKQNGNMSHKISRYVEHEL